MAADGEKGCALVHQKSSKPRPRLGLERERQWLCFDLGEVGGRVGQRWREVEREGRRERRVRSSRVVSQT